MLISIASNCDGNSANSERKARSFCGIPEKALRLRLATLVRSGKNSLRGTIPDGVGSAVGNSLWWSFENRLSGTIPDAFASMTLLLVLDVSVNELSGTIPAALPSDHENKQSVYACDNMLSGSLPSGLMSTQGSVFLGNNQLIGTLPSLETVVALMVSRNLLEGTVPNIVESSLRLLDLGGEAGRIGGLHGPLPPALRKASHLRFMAIANQQMEGTIPSFTSTLSLLALHTNRLKVLPEIHLEDIASSTVVLLHDNLLSCRLPWCGNASASVSVIAIGNHIQHPNTEFPAWVSQKERDPLLWVSGTAGMSLLQKIIAAVSFFVCAVTWKLGRSLLLTAISRWQIGPATHLWVVQASSHLLGCVAKESLLRALFLMLLLSWDLYACPQTLALASACSRSSTLIRSLVFLCWFNFSFHSVALEHLMLEGKAQKKQQTAKIWRKRLLLWFVWCALTLALSTFAILYQASKSIPGFIPGGMILSLAIGSIQGLVGSIVVPQLASKLTTQKHVFTTASNLIMNFLIPAVILIYLDTGCLGRWVSLWQPCRSSQESFEYRLLCSERIPKFPGSRD